MPASDKQNAFPSTAATPEESPNQTTRRDFLQGSLAVAGTVFAASIGAPAASAESNSKRPNLVFFFGEGQRADALSIAGNPILKTPNHDRIGREGMRFRNAFCTNALCAPARPSRPYGSNENPGFREPARAVEELRLGADPPSPRPECATRLLWCLRRARGGRWDLRGRTQRPGRQAECSLI